MSKVDFLDTFHDLPILIEQSFNEDRGGYILPTARSSSVTEKVRFVDWCENNDEM